jgi:hypothetical protein
MRRAHVVSMAALLAITACDGLFGPSAPRPAAISLSAIPTGTEVGATLSAVTAKVRDGNGRELGGVAVTWSVSHGTVSGAARTDRDGVATATWTVGTEATEQSITVRSGGVEDTRSASIAPGPVAQVVVAPGTVTLQSVGDTVWLDATAQDGYGNPVPEPRLTWSSTAPAVASVLGGRVISHSRGSATIAATSTVGNATGSAAVVVDQVMAGLRVTPANPVLVIGETLPLLAVAVDARGSVIDTTFEVSWESSAPAVASVSAGGVLTAAAGGTAVITARGAGRTADTRAEVRSGSRPTITSIAPSTLAPGETATIRGTGFSPTVSANRVTVAGVAAAVQLATETELRLTVPDDYMLPCSPTTYHPVVVAVDGLEASAEHPVATATQRALSIGESVSFQGGAAACNELTRGGTYVVSVFNTSTVPTSQAGFVLRGATATAADDATAAFQHRHDTPRPDVRPDPEAAAHLWMLEQNVRTATALSARVAPQRRAPAGPFPTAASAVGSTRTFRIPDLDATGLCGSFRTVTARAVYSGQHAVLWEDQAAPLAGQMDAKWRQIGQEYEEVMHPIIRNYFGDPLAYDDWLANPGRVNMLFSKHVNDFNRGVAAFVFSGDLYPNASCSSSDEMALFYARVPTAAGSGYGEGMADTWAWGMRSTIIHEVKHIVSFATRLRLAAQSASNPVFETTWLEESTARLAEEFYARAISGYQMGGNVGYQESIFCERRVGSNWPQCDHVPNIMHRHFGAIYSYYRNVHLLSPLGPATDGDWTFYGSGWLLLRWAMDHSSLSESAFSRALVNETQATGVANLSARTGRSFQDMLPDFTLAMMIDDYPGGLATRPELTFPSWNTRDIMNGLFQDYQGTAQAAHYDSPWPLGGGERALAFGTFDADVAGIRGGTAAFFRLSGPQEGRQLLELLGPTGAAASPTLGVAIVRVQ